jgi:hypothetical protein
MRSVVMHAVKAVRNDVTVVVHLWQKITSQSYDFLTYKYNDSVVVCYIDSFKLEENIFS